MNSYPVTRLSSLLVDRIICQLDDQVTNRLVTRTLQLETCLIGKSVNC